MTDHPLPGLATDGELAGQRSVVVCRECGRPLTDRAARLRALGDDCAHKLGERTAPDPGRFEVEQEGLFEERA